MKFLGGGEASNHLTGCGPRQGWCESHFVESIVVVSLRTTIASEIAMNKYSNRVNSNKANHRHIPKQKAELCSRDMSYLSLTQVVWLYPVAF